MNLLRAICALGALLSGIRALGYLVILQVGGVRPTQTFGVALTMCGAMLLFVTLTALSAYLRERNNGARAIFLKFLFLSGTYGLPGIALFAMASRGAVLRMPVVMGLLVAFVCFVVFLRTPGLKPRTPALSA
jgi:hypothetical protein